MLTEYMTASEKIAEFKQDINWLNSMSQGWNKKYAKGFANLRKRNQHIGVLNTKCFCVFCYRAKVVDERVGKSVSYLQTYSQKA